MATLRFGPEDRDERGFVAVAEPRSLADLLPTPAQIQASAQPAPATWTRTNLIIGGVLVLIAIGLASYIAGRAPQASPAPRPQPSATPTSSAPTPASAARSLIAFAAPDGVALGAIESTRVITPTAHYGSDWIQADVAGSGLVWLRASDVSGLAIVGPDLTPHVAPPPVARPASAPPVPLPTDPPQCVRVGTTGTMIERCGYESLDALQAEAQAAWMEKSGAHPAIVTTPTAYPERTP